MTFDTFHRSNKVSHSIPSEKAVEPSLRFLLGIPLLVLSWVPVAPYQLSHQRQARDWDRGFKMFQVTNCQYSMVILSKGNSEVEK